MEDEQDVIAELNEQFLEQHEEGGGPGPTHEAPPKVFASEDDDEGREEEPQGQQREPAEDPAAREQRLMEKERQAHGLTVAVRQLREENRLLHARMQMILERAMRPAEPEEEQEEEPDPEQDAVGAIRHDVRKVGEELAGRLEAIEQREAEKVLDAQVEDTMGWVQNDAASFAQQYPDYPEAAAFVADRMRAGIEARLRFENPGADPDQVASATETIFARDLANLHLMYRRRGQSFAAAVYGAAPGAGWARGQGGGQSRRAARQGEHPELEAARRRVAASRTLNGGGGAAPRRPLSKRDLVDMSDDKFAELLESGALDFKALAGSFGVQE